MALIQKETVSLLLDVHNCHAMIPAAPLLAPALLPAGLLPPAGYFVLRSSVG
ncbi:hypothetical protein [Paenibacillus anseongense]|uniref:hypothetical protein n=1 Tax=Paenibacillus anseongense TaxID=2682845 RepID=UPI001C88CAEC|nr:hypothetical protein [Paenibacillus anseongense]